MFNTKQYTREQIANAEELAALISKMPAEKQSAVIMMANAFIAGMEANARLTSAHTASSANANI